MPSSCSTHSNVLIIGQGLAGTALAWHLWKQGIPFLIVDEDIADTSSKVAAGLITPITGMRLNLGWRVAELIPASRSFYQQIEQVLHAKFYHEIPHVRFFKDERELQLWEKRRQDAHFLAWIKSPSELASSPLFHDELGGISQQGSGWLNTSSYLSASRQFFIDKQCWRKALLQENELEVNDHHILWQNQSFSHAVFCQGWQAQGNRWFPDLPFHSARGVIAQLHPEQPIHLRQIYNRTGWIAPNEDAGWRAGSTYEFDFHRPLEASLEDIHRKLRHLLKTPFHLTNPRAGIRPIIKKRAAILGTHPIHRRLAIFNGLGSKGAMKSPLLASWLIAHLFEQQPLPQDVDVCANF